ncbi:hypothetical protein B0G76_1631 [Paraburkholderia sp. BL23I1N1]|uniref:hypothetical protein n=1 Tax=unclassified Paraburkholderia TaxID=2615204 RepID=UPI000E38C0E2|nr:MULTISPECIES: hypothetical protein [unclassified Paraburkholderia]REE18520.1 hypothetical protein B0G71_1560 [Paraburkholderia sp. BL27I4N3]RKE35534.1 hypothetical protein B0G76_1631 [Paraburkholderia sp. BL23I1N1]
MHVNFEGRLPDGTQTHRRHVAGTLEQATADCLPERAKGICRISTLPGSTPSVRIIAAVPACSMIVSRALVSIAALRVVPAPPQDRCPDRHA